LPALHLTVPIGVNPGVEVKHPAADRQRVVQACGVFKIPPG